MLRHSSIPRFLRLSGGGIFFIFLFSCEKEPVDSSITYMDIPDGFPAVEHPEDNSYSNDRWKLGKRLFFDPILSRDSTISCASCHRADFALADQLPVSPGVDGNLGTRNSPSLFNVGYFPYFMREGGVPSLEMQVLVPLQEHTEMDFNIVDAAQRISQDPTYVSAANKAYSRNPDAFVITRALAAYERTMISGNSTFDKSENGSATLTASEQRGADLFFSDRTNCSSCHDGFLFTNHSFANNGLYASYSDPGRYRLTSDSADLALFKVPSLRNVEYTAPYMHDGSIATLEDVIAHYNSGGANHPNKSAEIKPLNLTSSEVADLVAFLKSLSDPSVLTDERFQED